MDYDLMAALEEAWGVVGPKLAADAGEMAARKARRRLKTLGRPPRAWCLGVRACDTRMTDYRFAMVPHRVKFADREAGCMRYVPHEVTLDRRGLSWLCRPVHITWPGEEAKVVAERLGVNIALVHQAMKRGMFEVKYVTKWEGRGRVAVLWKKGWLDPSAMPLGKIEGPEWGTMWRFLSDHLPGDLSQTLRRVPYFREMRGREEFRGWRWECPGCGRLVGKVYYPVAGVTDPGLVRARFVMKEEEGSADEMKALECFACGRCHGVNHIGRMGHDDWNEAVAYLSGGLLYGKEVRRPDWWVVKRKRAYREMPGRRTSKREGPIIEMLVETGLTIEEMARELGLAVGTVRGWIGKIYKRRGVHSRGELRRKLGVMEGRRVREVA